VMSTCYCSYSVFFVLTWLYCDIKVYRSCFLTILD